METSLLPVSPSLSLLSLSLLSLSLLSLSLLSLSLLSLSLVSVSLSERRYSFSLPIGSRQPHGHPGICHIATLQNAITSGTSRLIESGVYEINCICGQNINDCYRT